MQKENNKDVSQSVKIIIEKTGKIIDFADFMNEVIDFEEVGGLDSKQSSPAK